MLIPITRLQTTLEANRQKIDGQTEEWPVVCLYTPLGKSVWLLSKVDPVDKDKAFGLCDDGFGHPTFQYVSLSELANRFGHLSVRWDDKFKAVQSLSDYAKVAREIGYIQR